jgi:hypothetical protein
MGNKTYLDKKNVDACYISQLLFKQISYIMLPIKVGCSTVLRVIVEFFLVFLTVTVVLDVVNTHCDLVW